jgi:uncharacterized membrane protein
MLGHLMVYGCMLIAMLVLDGIWLGVLMKGYYHRAMTRAVTFEVRWWAAILFYLLHTAGIVIFVLWSVGPEGALRDVLLRGALFGLFTYGTYDLTNLATVRHWSLHLTVVDIAWGCIVTMLTAGVGFAVFS